MGNWYCTREDVKESLDVKESARMDRVIDRAIEAGSRNIEAITRRVFYPNITTKYFDFPDRVTTYAYRQWIDLPDQLVRLDTLVSGGVTLDNTMYFVEPISLGPPYTRIEINVGQSRTFNALETWQRQTVVTGVWGYDLNWEYATVITATVNAAVTSIPVDNSAAVGVGDLIQIGDEWLQVTGKAMENTMATVTLTASKNDVTLTNVDLNVGEVILVDSERMLVVDVAGTTATVVRAYDGTVLAAHSTASVWAPRSLTVVRGANGSTAASHSSTDAVQDIVYRFNYPGPIRQLAIAEALVTLKQGEAAYARTVGAGDAQRESPGKGLQDVRNQVKANYGRRTRTMSV